MVTEKQAIAQILKMQGTLAKLDKAMEYEAGSDWYNRKLRNEKRNEKINAIYEKIRKYSAVITKEGYDNSDLPCELCQSYEDFTS